MKNLLIVSHPHLAMSHIHRPLLDELAELPDSRVHHLESMYPDGEIDLLAEQEACEHAQRLVWQFPLYWHSCPALLKRWQDDVLCPGWAYGRRQQLAGKTLWLVVSMATASRQYGTLDAAALAAILRPFQLTAEGLGMRWQPPLIMDIQPDTPQGDLAGAQLAQLQGFIARYREGLTAAWL
ncbi:NAD(P)H-dependent oxidoreductase [Chitinibacter tainanensis]|uniref:NAD(P)H-dependent oxidoreductase n=1 Tax=Chitinibacter tainanensis TaxID=230667 RepID=UPI002355F76D|nr:NAD(P)H-dependent oxidoreductase [Chitinibacter tainanensis]